MTVNEIKFNLQGSDGIVERVSQRINSDAHSIRLLMSSGDWLKAAFDEYTSCTKGGAFIGTEFSIMDLSVGRPYVEQPGVEFRTE